MFTFSSCNIESLDEEEQATATDNVEEYNYFQRNGYTIYKAFIKVTKNPAFSHFSVPLAH